MAKILVVEDEAIVRLLVVETLQNCGHSVLEAADGQAALDLFQDCPDLELIVTDIRLPKMDGFALARSARQLRPNLGLIFLTGYVRVQPPEELSPFAIIRKPFDPDNMARQVSTMLDPSRAVSG